MSSDEQSDKEVYTFSFPFLEHNTVMRMRSVKILYFYSSEISVSKNHMRT